MRRPQARRVGCGGEALMEKRLGETRFKAIPERLHEMRSALTVILDDAGCPKPVCRLLVLAINEACMNVIQHGYQGDPEGEIILEILNNNGELEFRLTDFADTVDPAKVKPRPLDEIRPGGLGTYFIQRIMDEVRFAVPESGKGNVLIMKKRFEKASEAPRHEL